MKNILEICNGLGLGGTEKVLQIFCKYLNKEKYNVFCVGIFRGGVRESYIREYVKDMLVSDGNIQEIQDFIMKHHIDIVHWHCISQNPGEEFEKTVELLTFLKEKNIPVIETSPFSFYNLRIDSLLSKKLFVSKINLIKYFWKFKKEITDPQKYGYHYNPLDVEVLETFRLTAEQKLELRRKYGLKQDDFVIGKVGRANLWKWDDAIIDIVPHLIPQIPNLKVVIRAIPELKRKKVIKKGLEKYFIFLEESVKEQDICETYQLMDVMVHTSRMGECNSVAINEALFFGIPVVTKSTDFLQKTIFDRDNGQIEIIANHINGFVARNNYEVGVFIEKIFFSEEMRISFGENNREKAKNTFSPLSIIHQIEEMFEQKESLHFDFYKEFIEYKQNVPQDSFLNLCIINMHALYDKIIHKA